MKESDIRPEALLRRYLELSASDADKCFAEAPRHAVNCVACDASAAEPQFSKNGFPYARCSACGTLFQTPRPTIEAYEAFYRESESARYWAEVFFPAVAEVRRERIFRPRVERLARYVRDHAIDVQRIVDVGAGYGILLDEWRRLFPSVTAVAIEPSAALAAECRRKGLTVVEDIVENVTGYNDYADVVTCFEVLEHVYEPVRFVEDLARLVRPGGGVFVSTLCIDGFDLQVLWEKSTQISPPHHINFMSVRGFVQLFERAGLVDVSVVTPGQLDVDIVRNYAKRDPALLTGQRFLQHLLANDATGAEFQRFLADNRLSSHAWVFGRRR